MKQLLVKTDVSLICSGIRGILGSKAVAACKNACVIHTFHSFISFLLYPVDQNTVIIGHKRK
jgi:hypothetical protein